MIFNIVWALILVGMTLSEPLSFASEPNKIFWAAGYVAVIIFAVRRPSALFRCVQQNYIVLLLPMLAFLSAIWSPSPGDALYNSFQFLMTNLIGFVIVMQKGRATALHILFLAFAFAVIFSIVDLLVNPHGAVGSWGGEFRGIYHTKNELGDMAAMLALSSLAIFIGEKPRLYAVVTFILAFLTIALTRSGTAMIAAIITLSCVPTIFVYRRGTASLPLVIGLQLLLFAPIAAYIIFGHIDVFDAALGSVGKDSTLTGRTVLWGFAVDGFLQNPWIGHGFKGWWDPSNPNVFFLRYVIGQDLWYFHDVFLEIAVSFGIVGVFLLIVTLVTSYKRALQAFLRSPIAPNLWNVLFVVYVTVACVAENALFVNHHVHQLILAMIFASTARSVSQRDHGHAFQNLSTNRREMLAAGRS